MHSIDIYLSIEERESGGGARYINRFLARQSRLAETLELKKGIKELDHISLFDLGNALIGSRFQIGEDAFVLADLKLEFGASFSQSRIQNDAEVDN